MPEEYTTLYRAFRPHRFCDVVGQGPIVQTLKNQVKSGRIAHAYLFNGTRGTGKTTTARILARAINCENPQDGEPCGVCPTCQALSQENNLDILEIDAASNGSVDQVRDLCAKVAYPPQACRYRVIIIDECTRCRPRPPRSTRCSRPWRSRRSTRSSSWPRPTRRSCRRPSCPAASATTSSASAQRTSRPSSPASARRRTASRGRGAAGHRPRGRGRHARRDQPAGPVHELFAEPHHRLRRAGRAGHGRGRGRASPLRTRWPRATWAGP